MERKSFKEFLGGLTVAQLVNNYGVPAGNAEGFVSDFKDYGLLALDVWIFEDTQVEMCHAYSWAYRRT